MDHQFLYRLGVCTINLGKLLRDRQYDTSSISFFKFDDPLRTSAELYTIAKNTNCSLGEAVRQTVYASGNAAGTKDANKSAPKMASIWCLDRNYDVLRQRDRMISTEQIKYLCDVMDLSTVNIVMSPNKLSPQARKEFPREAELFHFDDLLIDLPRHVLCIEHKVVSLDDARSVLGATLVASDLPALLQSDPMAKWNAWPKGTILFLKNPVMNSFRVVT